jgi:hypothetical protein
MGCDFVIAAVISDNAGVPIPLRWCPTAGSLAVRHSSGRLKTKRGGAPDRRVWVTGEGGVAGNQNGLGLHGRLTDRRVRWAGTVTMFPQVNGRLSDAGRSGL